MIFPSLLILLPIVLLFFLLKYWTKRKPISIGLKIILGIVFVAIGLLTSFYAITISLEGMADKNITCMTGVIVFIPFGWLTYIVGVPFLLSLSKKRV